MQEIEFVFNKNEAYKIVEFPNRETMIENFSKRNEFKIKIECQGLTFEITIAITTLEYESGSKFSFNFKAKKERIYITGYMQFNDAEQFWNGFIKLDAH